MLLAIGPFFVFLAFSESIRLSPIARAFPCFTSAITTISPVLKVPSMETIPGAMTVAPLHTNGTAPISTMIRGALAMNSENNSVGSILSFSLNNTGILERT